MLLSLVVQLEPQKNGKLPAATGPALHGAFFRWLTGVNPALARELHDIAGPKPFTVSGLQRHSDNPEIPLMLPELEIRPGQSYWFRLTSYEPRLSELLLSHFVAAPPTTLEILQHYFAVKQITYQPEQHPWAAATTWESLTGEALNSKNGSLKPKITLLFYSPTTFKTGSRAMPLPLPEQTFASLASRWNAYSPFPLNPAFFDYLAEQVAINAYDLRSELIRLDDANRKLLCFRGWCEYTAFGEDEEWNKALQLLAQFAFYSGTGYKTTMGCGQTLPVNRSQPPARTGFR